MLQTSVSSSVNGPFTTADTAIGFARDRQGEAKETEADLRPPRAIAVQVMMY